MGKSRKQKQKPQKAQKEQNTPKAKKGPIRWTLGHVVAAFFIGAMLGFVIGFEPRSAGNEGDQTDAYGRSPGDPHYSHTHP